MSERDKYERLWGEHKQYRRVAPGEHLADHFLLLANPRPDQTVYDFGCGTGRGAARIAQRCKVVGFDFAANALDDDVVGAFEFVQHDLTQAIDRPIADFGYCTDVLEHIPTADVRTVLRNIVTAARQVYLNISTVDDAMGALIGEPLHLTVQPMEWWQKQLESIGCKIHQSQDLGTSCLFWLTAYVDFAELHERSVLNIDDTRLRENVLSNIRLGLQELVPHEAQETHILLLAGGPSLADFEDEIVQYGRDGVPIVTVNGTYNWLLSRGIKPAAQFVVDGREFNKRFLEPVVDTCKYFFSSQAAHEAVTSVPRDQAWLYHAGDNTTIREMVETYSQEVGRAHEWYPVHGGTTVTGRALTVLAMLGFRRIEVFGWDSCLRGDAHHAYAQTENDGQSVIEVEVGGRQFACHPWMVIQAQEFPALVKHIYGLIDGFELSVRGDGLISHILNHAAEMATE